LENESHLKLRRNTLPLIIRQILGMASVLFALIGWVLAGNVCRASPELGQSKTTSLVLAAQDDAYFPLAQEIARAENISLVYRIEDVLGQNPEFLLWVVSPAKLSDRTVAQFGLALSERRTAISVGIISGTNIEQARALWQRANLVKSERVFAANGEYPSAHIFQPRLLTFEAGEPAQQSLTKEILIRTIQNADYLTFTGHGGSGYLRLDDRTTLTAADIPALPPLVIGTGSCQTFRIWKDNSIALAFTDHGAAAYAGFAYSPNEGFLFGEFDGLPFRYTWDDFPIGHVMQIQTRGTLRGFAQFPYHFLLGDPRIALQKNPPYRVIKESEEGNRRTLVYADALRGIIPVRISGGAAYHFTEILGIASAGDDDLFYNTRLQTANIGNDKTVLFKHRGGDFTLQLERDTPWLWSIGAPLRDSLDAALLFSQQNGGEFFSIGAGVLTWLMVLWRLWRRKAERTHLPLALIAGFAFALAHGGYALLRLPNFTLNEKPIVFGALPLIGTFILTTGAAFLYVNAQSRRGKIGAMLLTVLPTLIGIIFLFGSFFSINLMSAQTLGTGIYNYSLVLMFSIALVFETILFAIAFEMIRKLSTIKTRRI
jgi:hypothetical protein